MFFKDREGGRSRGWSNSAYERPKRTVRVPILLMLTVRRLLNSKLMGHNNLASLGQGKSLSLKPTSCESQESIVRVQSPMSLGMCVSVKPTRKTSQGDVMWYVGRSARQ